MSKTDKSELIARMDTLLAERNHAVEFAWSIKETKSQAWRDAMGIIAVINGEMRQTADAIAPRCKHWGVDDCYHFYGIKPMTA